ncbi:MAG: hypothetical protein EPO24_09295 [Bacteroidetes bacterium]|nr:MAG: hypothetical protein EPO24_09295 [Bacteroidota bacterium]
MPQRKKKDISDLSPVQQRIIQSLESLDRSLRWLALKIDIDYPVLWSKVWTNDKIDAETVARIGSVLKNENKEFTTGYFMGLSPQSQTIHFSLPGHVSEAQSRRIHELAEKLKEISESEKDTELILQIVNKILGKGNE